MADYPWAPGLHPDLSVTADTSVSGEMPEPLAKTDFPACVNYLWASLVAQR